VSPATTERRNTSKTTLFGYTPPAETAVAPKPEVALRQFLLTSKSIVVYIQKYYCDLIHVTSGVASHDGTSKYVENDAIRLYAAGGNGCRSETGSSTAAIFINFEEHCSIYPKILLRPNSLHFRCRHRRRNIERRRKRRNLTIRRRRKRLELRHRK